MDQETISSEYGPDYYAHSLGPIPYERSAHWVNFFAIIADQLIRSVKPRRVLDAGCAMGFLVEAFWDRGVYCEGIDISDFAISQVRRDVRPFCSVASLTEPITGNFDLITCIEVLEHLQPEIVRTAVANICGATEALLFSSTPSDFEEPTHYSVRAPIFWLELFAEFDFWPDARFDASFVCGHAMLLRKGNPPPDDFLRLFSEYLRFRTSFETRVAELRASALEIETLRSQNETLQIEKVDHLTNQLNAQSLLDSAVRQKVDLESRAGLLETTVADLQQQLIRKESTADQERLKIQQALTHSETARGALLEEATRLRHQNAEQHSLLETLSADVQTLRNQLEKAQHTVNAVLHSRAWKLAERCRWPLRKLRGLRKPAPVTVPPNPSSLNLAPVLSPQQLPSSGAIVSFDGAYQRWINEQEPDDDQILDQKRRAESLDGPIISVVVPVHQTDHQMLKACVGSVLAQTYPKWQLCLAITPDPDRTNEEYLQKLAKQDQRIRVRALSANEGISANTNAALGLATGDFVGLLDHDDTLANFAFFEIACWLNKHGDTDIIYSDHDYLDAESGLRCNPLFKPSWSPEIMFSANYITHLTVVRRSLLDRIGHFDPLTDGAQDWDLFLRATEATAQISHIPKILYHWRMHPGSTANNNAAKDYAADAQLLAIQRYMDKRGMKAAPEVKANGLLHVRFVETPKALVSIIIPTKDRIDLLERCLSTLLTITEDCQFEVLIVDTGSKEDATREYFRSLSHDDRIRVIWHPGAFNYSGANNRASREAKGDFLLFLNNDVEITNPQWLHELVCWANLPEVGIVGAKLLRGDGSLQHAGVVLGMSGFADHPFADGPAFSFGLAGSTGWYRNYLAVTGACMMMRRQVFTDIGGFDEDFILCGSDVELCLRAWDRGYRVVYNPFAELIHHERQSRGTDVPPNDFVESFRHYKPWLTSGDPFWNPNLSLWSKQPAFKFRTDPSSLLFAEEFAKKSEEALTGSNERRPLNDEERIVKWFDCGAEQFDRVRLANSLIRGMHPVKRVLWFIPDFQVPFYGGIFTILRFSQLWSELEGVEIFFAICGAGEHQKSVGLIRQVYSRVDADHVFVLPSTESASGLPKVDASICTLWTTAYYALHHKEVARRFYLVQDFEPAFYCAGSVSAIVESTYRMGLYGIANTVSLKQMYEAEYGGRAIHFTPRINSAVFNYDESSRGGSEKQLQVFFYGRPKHARNAFELVKEAMQQLKSRLGDRVRIVSAGEEWNPAEYGLKGIVENLGLLEYADTARLYRESHIGVVMMLTRHPSYIPLELMASGCLTVTNINAWTTWLLKDGVNCLLTPATAGAVADTVERGLTDTALRERICAEALRMVSSEYLDWSSQAKKVYSFLCDPEAFLAG